MVRGQYVARDEGMQLGEHLARGASPGRHETVERRAGAQGTLKDWVGDHAVAYGLKIVDVALEGGAGDRRPQTDLGGDRAAGATKRPVAQGPVDGGARLIEGRSDIGQGQEGGKHAKTVSERAGTRAAIVF